jgi:hypothetical protein
MVASVRPATNVSPEVFVKKCLEHANRADGCIDSIAAELGLTPKSCYARYAKYRKELKKAGVIMPALPQSIERKATIDWKALAAIVSAPPTDEAADDDTQDESDGTVLEDDDSEMEITEGEYEESVK